MRHHYLFTFKKIIFLIVALLVMAPPFLHPSPAYAETTEYMCQISTNPNNVGLNFYLPKFYETGDPTKNEKNLSQEVGPTDVSVYQQLAWSVKDTVTEMTVDWGDGTIDTLPHHDEDCSQFNPDWNFKITIWPEYTSSHIIACGSSAGTDPNNPNDPNWFFMQVKYLNHLGVSTPENRKLHDKSFRIISCLQPTPTTDPNPEPTPTHGPNQAPTVLAGPDITGIVGEEVALAPTKATRVSDDGYPNPPGSMTIKWEVVEAPDNYTVVFSNVNAVRTTAIFSKPGTYVLRLSANDSEYESEDFKTITITSPVDHYRVEFKSWIAQKDVVDPMMITSFQSPNKNNTFLGEPLKSCFTTAAGSNQILGNTKVIQSIFHGDNHNDYGFINNVQHDYRIYSWVEFDFDGSTITNMTQGNSVGVSTRDMQIQGSSGAQIRCLQRARSNPSLLVPSTQVDNNTIHMEVVGADPLVPRNFRELCNTLLPNCPLTTFPNINSVLFTPTLDGEADVNLDENGEVTIDYTTDLFPNYGFAVIKNTIPQYTKVVANTGCRESLGYSGASKLMLGLQTISFPRYSGTASKSTVEPACQPNPFNPQLLRATETSLRLMITPYTEPTSLIFVSNLSSF